MITLHLKKICFTHDILKDSDKRYLRYDAALIRDIRFYVKGRKPMTKGYVTITEGMPVDEIARITFMQAWKDDRHEQPDTFDVHMRIPPSTFEYLLNCDESEGFIELIVNFDTLNGNINYLGEEELIWDRDNKEWETAESVSLRHGFHNLNKA
jgi:hypothetical protein